MSFREDAIRANPDFSWLAVDDVAGVATYLESRGFLEPGETFLRCEPAGEGNMNLTLRIHTSARRFILKQSRPWVEKYPQIEAPWDRSQNELHFYERIKEIAPVASMMPDLIAGSGADRVLLLEDLEGALDLTPLYSSGASSAGAEAALSNEEVDRLAGYLAALHEATRGIAAEEFANREMRALNHAHIFVVPLDPNNGLELDDLEPGLAAAAQRLQDDSEYCKAITETGDRYLRDGPCLVHGDYFPGSWLRTPNGLRVIDPEFSFPGDPEVDLACAVAHFALAGQAPEIADRLLAAYATTAAKPDATWLARYAAAEVMRRLIGVAQLPLAAPEPKAPKDPRSRLLEKSRLTMASGQARDLF